MSSRVSSRSWPGTVGEDQQWRSWGCWCRWFLTRAFWRTSPWEAPACQPRYRILGYNYKLNLNLLTQRRNWRRFTSNQKQEKIFLVWRETFSGLYFRHSFIKNFSHHHSLWYLNRCLWRRIKLSYLGSWQNSSICWQQDFESLKKSIWMNLPHRHLHYSSIRL